VPADSRAATTLTASALGETGLERPATAVVEDVLDGYLTREAAARDFRVAIGADGKLDAAATTGSEPNQAVGLLRIS